MKWIKINVYIEAAGYLFFSKDVYSSEQNSVKPTERNDMDCHQCITAWGSEMITAIGWKR